MDAIRAHTLHFEILASGFTSQDKHGGRDEVIVTWRVFLFYM